MSKKKKWFRYHLKIHHWTNGDKDYSIIEQVVTKGERPKDFYRFYTEISVKVPLKNAAGSLMADQDGSLLAKGRSEKVPINAKDIDEACRKLVSLIDRKSKQMEAEIKKEIEKDKLWTPDQKPLVTP